MKLKIRLSIATGTVITGAAIGLMSQVAFAQSQPVRSQKAVEQEIALVATQFTDNLNSFANSTLVSAEAHGLTLSLHFRLKENRNLTVEQYEAQVTTPICQNPTMRQYTDQYGVVLDINVAAAQWNGAHSFQIDRAACARTAGAIAAPPAGQARSANSQLPLTGSGLQRCSAYVGQTVQPQSFDNAAARFSGLTPKSEYETTAQFEARQAQALAGAGGTLIIEKAPEDRKFFEYDADGQALRILPFAFDNKFFPAWEAFYAAGLNGSLNVNVNDNVDAVISEDERATGSYEASNAYGAKATVVSLTRTVQVIFDHGPKLGGRREALFPGSITDDYKVNPVGVLPMSPDQARLMKPGLRLAFVATPYRPFLVRGTTKFGKVTFQNPRDITYSYTILTADIQCGLVMDESGLVLGAYSTS